MKVCFLNDHNNINTYLLNNHNDGYVFKEDISLISSLIKIIIACIYAFGLGYRIFFTGDNFIKLGVEFLYILIITYFILKIIYSFSKALLFPNVFIKDIIQLKINPFNMHILVLSSKPVKKKRLLLSLLTPCLLFAIIPNILNLILEFNIFLYAFTSVGTIISIEDLVFSIEIVKNNKLQEYLIVTPFGYINTNLTSSEISVELNKILNIYSEESLNIESEECNNETCYQILEYTDEDISKK